MTDSEAALEAMIGSLAAVDFDLDLEKGIALMEQAVAHDPTFALGWLFAGIMQINANLTDEARHSLEEAQRHAYRLTESSRLELESWRYRLEGETEKYLTLLEMQAELAPDDLQVQVQLAAAYQNGRQHEKAFTQLEKVLEVAPDPYVYYHSIGWSLRNMGKREEAYRYFKGYVERFPRKAEGYHVLGRFHGSLGEYDEAERCLERAILLEDRFEIRSSLAELAVARGDYQVAGSRYAALVRETEDPRDLCAALEDLRELLIRLRRYDEAVAVLERDLEVGRHFRTRVEHFFLQLNQQALYVTAGQPQKSLAILARMEQEIGPPWDAFIPFGYVLHYIAAEDGEKAERTLTSMRETMDAMRFTYGGVSNFDRLMWIETHELLGNYGEALKRFRAYAVAEPEDRHIPLVMGRLLRKKGELAEAEIYLEQALEHLPHDPETLEEMALLLEATGRAEQAIAYRERVAEILATPIDVE